MLARAALAYLSCTFTSSLTVGLPQFTTWSIQILSALAWAQVAMASDFPRLQVMRPLHMVVRHVFAASPWAPENTTRRVRCSTPDAVPTGCSSQRSGGMAREMSSLEGDTLH